MRLRTCRQVGRFDRLGIGACVDGKRGNAGSHRDALYSACRVDFTYSLTADRGYLVCEYLSEKTDTAEVKPSDHLTIFTYHDAAKTYKHFGINKDYKTLEEPTVIIEGNVWRYNDELPDEKGNKLDCRERYEFVQPEKMITRVEISADDGQHWTLVSESVARRVR